MTLFSVSCEKSPSSTGDEAGIIWFSVSADDTKASIVTTTDLQTKGKSFSLDAWLEEDNRGISYPEDDVHPHYIKKGTVTLGDDGWKGTNLTWRSGVWTNFFAVYPVSATGREDLKWPVTEEKDITDAQEKTPSFFYDMTSYTASSTAALNTPDLLVAYARGKWNEDDKSGGEIKLNMQHAMAGIYFVLDHVDAGCSIKDVTVAGIHYKGTCELSATTKDLKDTITTMKWEYEDTPSASVGFTCLAANFTENDYFFLIPQQLENSAVLRATVNDGTSDDNKEVNIAGFTWKAGYKYKYSLSYYKDKDELVVTTSTYNTSTGEWID